MKKLTRQECLDLGIHYIKKHKCYPAAKKWTIATAGCSRDRIYENWDSWLDFTHDLKKHTTVPKSVNVGNTKYSEKDFINFLNISATNNNGYPKYTDFLYRKDFPSITAIRERYGSWSTFLSKYGYNKKLSYFTDGDELSLFEALDFCFENNGYIIPDSYNISRESFLRLLASRVTTKDGALGLTSSKWRSLILDVFPDKPKKTNYYNWLLLKDNLLFCSCCLTVKSINNFRKSSKSSTGFQNYCKKCMKPLLAKSQKSIQAKYRAKKLKATPSWANQELIKNFYYNCPSGYHVDHIIPLQGDNVCGLHVENNLQYLLAEDNIVKGNKYVNTYKNTEEN